MSHLKTIPLLVLASFAFSTQAKADVNMTAIIRDHNLSAIEAAAAIVIADALNLDADFVVSTSRNYGTRPSILGPVWVMSRESRRPLPEVWRSYRKGKGWGNVAKECGIHPGHFNKMRAKGKYNYDELIWMNCANDRYGWNESQWNNFRRSGYSQHQVIYASVEGRGNYTRARDSAKNKSWNNYSDDSRRGGQPQERGRTQNSKGERARESIQGPTKSKPAPTRRPVQSQNKSKPAPQKRGSVQGQQKSKPAPPKRGSVQNRDKGKPQSNAKRSNGNGRSGNSESKNKGGGNKGRERD